MSEEPLSDAVVYVVDDDASVRKAMTRKFKSLGWRVFAFGSAREFLEFERANVPGCLLLDVRMPGLSGLELQEALVSHHIRLPIVFMTAHGDIPMSVKAIKGGAVDFLPKPMDEKQLVRTVREAIARHAREREGNARLREFRRRVRSLTPREHEIMTLLIRGLLNKQMAGELDITGHTVKKHRSQVMKKTGVESVAELVKLCEQAKIDA